MPALPMPANAQRAAQSMIPLEGNTYPIKDALKALGARWEASIKVPAESESIHKQQEVVPMSNPRQSQILAISTVIIFDRDTDVFRWSVQVQNTVGNVSLTGTEATKRDARHSALEAAAALSNACVEVGRD